MSLLVLAEPYEGIEAIYDAGFWCWNHITEFTVKLLNPASTDGSAAFFTGGSIYNVASNFLSGFIDISTVICMVFFLIGIIKEVISTPIDQSHNKLFFTVIKFGVILAVLNNLVTIMGNIMNICSAFTTYMLGSTTTISELSISDMEGFTDVLEANLASPALDGWDFGAFFADVFGRFLVNIIVAFFGSIFSFLACIGCAFVILFVTYKILFKPLLILPFASISIAMGSGSHETSQVMYSYLKTFIGCCLGTSIIVVAITLGNAAIGNVSIFTLDNQTGIGAIIAWSVSMSLSPLITAGLCKVSESLLSRFL